MPLRSVLAFETGMLRPGYVLVGALAGVLIARQRSARQRAERFAAAALETLLGAIDANDPQTGAHVRRVAAYALVLADAMDLDPDERRTVELAALFHDIGKIHEALFDIVHEQHRLDASERRAVATHPARGAQVLAPIAHFHPRLAAAVLAHHERWDGTGYPRGLRGRRIPLAARIVTIADTFDAITYNRRYRKGRTVREAARIIANGRGTQFDPEIVDVFVLPPVLECFAHEHRVSARTLGRPRDNGDVAERPPKIEIRWRTNTTLPAGLERQVEQSR
jgi:HD-GYP domain-containing protein (c-di-GMP phosphodiesterase class II)